MVVRFVAEDGHSAIELLDGHEANHLVGESHLTEGDLAVSTLIDRFAEAIRASHDECKVFAGSHLFLQEFCIFNRPKLPSVFIKQKHIHCRHKARKDGFAFGGLELVLAKRFGVFDIRNDHQFKRHIVFEPLLIVFNKGNQPCVSRLPRQKQLNLHL